MSAIIRCISKVVASRCPVMNQWLKIHSLDVFRGGGGGGGGQTDVGGGHF